MSFCSVCCKMSYIKRVFSPINLLFIKPVWSLEIILSSTNFILFAIVPEASLYTLSKRVKGLQFFKIFFVYYLSEHMLLCLVFELLKAVLCYIHNLLI